MNISLGTSFCWRSCLSVRANPFFSILIVDVNSWCCWQANREAHMLTRRFLLFSLKTSGIHTPSLWTWLMGFNSYYGRLVIIHHTDMDRHGLRHLNDLYQTQIVFPRHSWLMHHSSITYLIFTNFFVVLNTQNKLFDSRTLK